MKSGSPPARINSRFGKAALLILVLLSSVVIPDLFAQYTALPKRILVLYWYNKDHPWNVNFDQSFQAVLRSARRGAVEYYAEYLESDRFPEQHQSVVMHDYLRKKYRDRDMDVVIANSDASLDFLLKYRDDLFPRSPIVFVATRPPAKERAGPAGITGIVNVSTHRKTLDVALTLHPDTEQVYVITGTLQHDKKLEAVAREEFRDYEGRVRFTYLTDCSPTELPAITRNLPRRSIVLYVWQQMLTEEGKVLETEDVLALFASSTPVPIYGMSTPAVGLGIVGGYINTAGATGTRAAEMALQIANGTSPQDISYESAPSVPTFDWRALRRWGISEDELPAGSVVRFKTLTLWEQNKPYVLGAITLIAIQSALVGWLFFERRRRFQTEEARHQLAAIVESSEDAITGLSLDGEILTWNGGAELMYGYAPTDVLGRPLSIIVPPDRMEEHCECLKKLSSGERIEDFETVRIKKDGARIDVSVSISFIKDARGRNIGAATIARDVSERKRTEEALRESEARFRNFADTAPVLVWMADTNKLCTYVNCESLKFTGRSMEQELGKGWAEAVHPDDYQRCLKIYNTASDARENFSMEYRVRRHDGEYRWLVDSGVPRYTPDRTFAGYIGCAIDVTDRKRAEEEFQRLAVRLLNFQDTERRRLARELHDVTAQNLFAMNMNLSRLQRGFLPLPEVQHLVTESKQLCDQALQEIRTLSYLLHPPILDQAGLVSALRWYVEGFVKRSDINIDINCIQEVGRLSRDIETALFRVVQESLTNVSRHSGSSSGEITLRREGDEIILQITDHGLGMSKAVKRENGGAESLGVGISGMRERLRQFGGLLQIELTDFGTTVTAKVPALYETSGAGNDEGYDRQTNAQPVVVRPFRKGSSQ